MKHFELIEISWKYRICLQLYLYCMLYNFLIKVKKVLIIQNKTNHTTESSTQVNKWRMHKLTEDRRMARNLCVYLYFIRNARLNKRPTGVNGHLSIRDFTLNSCQKGAYLHINSPIIIIKINNCIGKQHHCPLTQ